ncbi:hypothetical protein HanHA300_Chr16g0600661 [Helianthus annuus]|nr:hypothetical protein HanHA300_Chr16g0600661 [Helianthus annuus]KAJ0459630.1 hypothetical protein HanHA89_Chr16g0651181 [Helianthus annuus]KAJ0640119.1 hypothetical protein HanLR1_Chr16g0611631 [Helianthus annuus]KAJ0644076.1 hypothetical protein HanOQP8_Chr16g0607861 [Helianthus annuus]
MACALHMRRPKAKRKFGAFLVFIIKNDIFYLGFKTTIEAPGYLLSRL